MSAVPLPSPRVAVRIKPPRTKVRGVLLAAETVRSRSGVPIQPSFYVWRGKDNPKAMRLLVQLGHLGIE